MIELNKIGDKEEDEYAGFEEDLLKDKKEEEDEINNENHNNDKPIENQSDKIIPL
jgi:hypothetical protein